MRQYLLKYLISNRFEDRARNVRILVKEISPNIIAVTENGLHIERKRVQAKKIRGELRGIYFFRTDYKWTTWSSRT